MTPPSPILFDWLNKSLAIVIAEQATQHQKQATHQKQAAQYQKQA
jgi:hypothetical protein